VNNNSVIRKTIIHKNQICANCGEELQSGSTVIVNASVNKRRITRIYYCLNCGGKIK